MNIHSEPFVPRLNLSANDNIFSIEPAITYQFWTSSFLPGEIWRPGQPPTYRPLGQESSNIQSDNAEWTPLWSDMFQMAEQEWERRYMEEHEHREQGRRWCNEYICAQRNLIHVQPVRCYCIAQMLPGPVAPTGPSRLRV
jgi:hypothetical protein